MPNKMSRAAAKDKTTTEDVILERLSVLDPKKQFISSAMNMGWQLAGAVLIPVLIGTKLDGHFHTTPSYTLTALVLASAGVVAIVSNTIKTLPTYVSKKSKLTTLKGDKRAK